MRWARDVIAPLLVASALPQTLCFSAWQPPNPPLAVPHAGSEWPPQHDPAGRRQGHTSYSWSVRLRGCRSHPKPHHEHRARGASAGCGLQVMTASSAGGGVPMTTTGVATSDPPITSTRYTIDVGVHPDVASLAVKHARGLPRFLEHYPISSHTKVAYGEAVAFVREFHQLHRGSSTSSEAGRQRQETKQQQQQQRHPLPVVLDSGCGTGRSSVLLAKSHPDLPVIGVDRSAARLSKRGSMAGREGSAARRHQGEVGEQNDAEQDGGGDQDSLCKDVDEEKSYPARSTGGNSRRRRRRRGEPLPENLLLLRADLVDLWILASRDDEWEVRDHFILYPNPYPKRSQLRSRWHGHPVFPILLGLGGRLTLRSNWRSYLEEVCQAVLAINDEAEKEKGQKICSSEDELTGFGSERGALGSGRHDVEGAASSEVGLSGEVGKVAVNGDVGGGISRETAVDSTKAVAATDAAATLPAMEIPVAAAAAAASYAASARAGPSMFKPAVPASTNFEAKYVAVGETVYELRLEPRQAKSLDGSHD